MLKETYLKEISMNNIKYNVHIPEEAYLLLSHAANVAKSSVDEILAEIIQEYLGDGEWDREEYEYSCDDGDER
jgi:hypothetical protein